MHITFVLNSMHGGGAERVALVLAKEFINKGHCVRLVLFQRSGKLLEKIPSYLQVIFLNDKPTLFACLNPLSNFRRWLQSLKRWNDTDIVLCFGSKINRTVLLGFKLERINIPVILSEHNVFSKDLEERNLLRRFYILFSSRYLYPKANALVAVSDYVRSDCLKLKLLPAEKTITIYNPVHVENSYKNCSCHPWLANSKVATILSIGSLFRVKDHCTLVKAFNILHKKHPDFRLIILGEGGQRSRIEKLIDKLGLNTFVDMPGFCNTEDYYKNADIFVLPSKHEAFSLVCAEALSHGLNIVSTDNGGGTELLQYGKYGKIVPVGDYFAMAKAIENTLQNPLPETYLRMATANYTPEKISMRYLNLFRETLTYSNNTIELPPNSKILLVELGGFGDVAQCCADAALLKKWNPTVSIWLLVKPIFQNFVSLQAHIDGVITGNKKPFFTLWNTANQIRSGNFDYMTNLSKCGGHSVILQALCNIPNKLPKMTWRPREDFILETSALRDEIKNEIKASTPTKKVFVCIGSGGSDLKKWPNKYWKDLLRRLTAEDWGVVFCGNGANEQADAKEICSVLPSGKYINFIDKTELEELAGIAKQCDMCIGNDTGLLHIAALSGVPSIGLFSQPTSWRVGLRMPWFKEISATNEIKKFRWEDKNTEYVLDRISPSTVYDEFSKLAEKFGL